MQLVMFGIDKYKNLIIQFPVFIQPYTQQPLILYQIETVQLPIIDQNTQAQSYVDFGIFSKTEFKFVGRQAFASIKHGFFQV